MPNSIFAYGTLKRGQCRESMWPAQAMTVQTAWVRGTLFGRRDYPALKSGGDRVLGELWTFADSDMPQVLLTLDQIEGANQDGVADLYCRVIVEVFGVDGDLLGEAFTYHYATDPIADGFTQIHATADSDYVAWPAAVNSY